MSIHGLRSGLAVLAVVCVTHRGTSQQLTLRTVFDSILKNHPGLQAANARVDAARGQRRSAGALGNPVLSYQVENTAFPGGRAPLGLDRETMFMATLPLEPLIQRSPRVRQADAAINAATADGQAARARLAMDAANAYYRVALAQVAAATARDLAGWLDSVVAYNRNRVKEGAAAEVDLMRSETERDRALAEATMREADLARARADLTAYLGDPRSTSTGFAVIVESVPLALPAGSGAGVRPEIRAARDRIAAASSGVSLEQLMTVRQFGAMFGLKQTAGTSSMIAGLSFPVPFFDANRGGIQRAAAEREAAAFELAALERTTNAELAGAIEVARLLAERATVLATGGANGFLARAEEARRITLGAYREGAVPLMQVLDAARAWSDARVTFYQILYAQHQSVLALLTVQGADLLLTLPSSSAAGARTQ